MTMRTCGVRQVARSLWREQVALATAALCGGLLVSTGCPAAAAAVVAGNLGGTALLFAMTLSGGHLGRSLRWLRLRQGLRLAGERGQRALAAIAPVADAAEGLLSAVDGARPQVRQYLAPCRDGALQVASRCLDLADVGRRIERRLDGLDAERLAQEAAELRDARDAAGDPDVRRHLDDALRAVHEQQGVGQRQRQALARIRSELQAARQSLVAVDERIHEVSHVMDTPAGDGPGAQPIRAELEGRVAALDEAAQALGGDA